MDNCAQQYAAFPAGGGDGASAAGRSAANGASGASRRSRYSARGRKVVVRERYHVRRLPALDMANAVYELRRVEAAAGRAGRTLQVRVRFFVVFAAF